FCFTMTSRIFWKNWEHWRMPCCIPILFSQCAVMQELFDFIVELQPSLTSSGLEEHVKHMKPFTDESAYYNVTNLILGMCLSLDNTFKLAVKVTIVNKDRTHTKVMKGGILSMLNEDNEIMSWVSQSIMSNSTGAGD
ncbi:hypothetical protein L208DRAFT_1231515, partial [Tricholoma matsutake]